MMMLKFFIVFIMKKKNSYKKKPNKDGPWQDIKTWHEAVMHNVLDFRTKRSSDIKITLDFLHLNLLHNN